MARTLTPLLGGGAFFEGPRWRDGRWWVSDFFRRTVSTVTPDGREEVVAAVPGQPSGLGWLPDGTLLVVSMLDRRLLAVGPGGALSPYADLAAYGDTPRNDLVVDAAGRAYVGEFGFDLGGGAPPAPGRLLRVDPDGAVSVAAADLAFANGAVVTPDGATLVVGETFGRRYTAFDVDPDGGLSNRRVWADLTDVRGRFVAPDGCCLDAEGALWCADAVGRRVLRLAEGGAVLAEVAAPGGLGVFACMLGGDDGRTLLLACAPDFDARRRAAAREAVLVTTTVDVPHAGLP